LTQREREATYRERGLERVRGLQREREGEATYRERG
jgi:hypothetical protein